MLSFTKRKYCLHEEVYKNYQITFIYSFTNLRNTFCNFNTTMNLGAGLMLKLVIAFKLTLFKLTFLLNISKSLLPVLFLILVKSLVPVLFLILVQALKSLLPVLFLILVQALKSLLPVLFRILVQALMSLVPVLFRILVQALKSLVPVFCFILNPYLKYLLRM
uniref:Uncharacterized protein n=1 Tax=Labrus bergylta TaxID=56723 RepID=A0A3Q3FUA8_9LABR